MTEERNKIELEKMVMKVVIVAVIGIALLLVGVAIVLSALISLDDKMIPDNEHITDQGMPIRDIENATYTWTSDEIDNMIKEKTDDMKVGVYFVAPGTALLYSAIIVVPSKTKLHQIGCKTWEDVKYCPECGLKMSKFQKQRKD